MDLSRQPALRRAVVLLCVAGMFLPAYGPLLDPGYAEDIPGHSHVMVEGASMAAHRAAPDDDTGVYAVPDPDDGGTFAVVIAGAVVALVALAAVAPLGLPAILDLLRSPTIPRGWIVATSFPPPKALSSA